MYMKDMEQLLRMVERPQDYSDEEIMKLVSDPEMKAYYELMVSAEAGFALKRSEEPKVYTRAKLYSLSSRFLKVAAVFIGVILLSGIAFAAYRYVVGEGPSVGGDLESPTQEVRISNSPQQVQTETESVRTFENAELQQILQELSDYYHVGVEFHNEQSRHIRLYTKWDTTAPLQQIIELLNGFEKVNVRLIDNKIIAE
jgi:hypothetical protein